ncbi:Hypothetical protein MALK_1290 [Metamycoplasma alkalescens 14918]|uniref:Uncharacterized protein n=1 Tax=Metamycoplasma alkalescens 14918 TaxID=1188234 RepID=N9U0I8_9BACT|nr:Hypothetical protein MALK_1290 [Metamycoplasma alkalescens 14918]
MLFFLIFLFLIMTIFKIDNYDFLDYDFWFFLFKFTFEFLFWMLLLLAISYNKKTLDILECVKN